MAYSIEDKFKKNSPLPCWKGYERVPGTKKGAKGSCRKKKSSPAKVKKIKLLELSVKLVKLVNIKEILKATLLVLKVKI
jgi:hypothetical protein